MPGIFTKKKESYNIVNKNAITGKQVKEANRRLYDEVAECYEEIDGRRSSALKMWLRGNLSNIKEQVSGSCLLDIGSGSGLVTNCAKGLFSPRVGVDLSFEILKAHSHTFDLGVNADVDNLPFADNSFDVVTCFAVLHHLYDFEGLVAEVARILKPGGIFYSDHDMDQTFNRRFKIPLSFYRMIHNAKAKYVNAKKEITSDLYDLTEWQQNGVMIEHIIDLLTKKNFSIKVKYHWFGLNPITDFLFGGKEYGCGWGPIVSLEGVKK